MAGQTGVHVEGLRETIKGLERMGVEAQELKDVMGPIAAEAAETAQRFIPELSGALRRSARGNKAKAKAVVTVGSVRLPYAGPIAWGWEQHNIRPSLFPQKTDRVMEKKAPEMLEVGLQKIIERHGLG